MSDEDDLINSLVSDLKASTKQTAQLQEQQSLNPIEKESLEAFVMDNSGALIKNGVQTVLQLQQRILQGGSDEIIAYAEVMKAVVSSIETLNKIVSTDKNIKNKTELKKLDIETKLRIEGGNVTTPKGITMTPEDLMDVIRKAQNQELPVDKAKKAEIIDLQS